jgi:hypothetical protein
MFETPANQSNTSGQGCWRKLKLIKPSSSGFAFSSSLFGSTGGFSGRLMTLGPALSSGFFPLVAALFSAPSVFFWSSGLAGDFPSAAGMGFPSGPTGTFAGRPPGTAFGATRGAACCA